MGGYSERAKAEALKKGLLPRYGGYSLSEGFKKWATKVVSPLWGLFSVRFTILSSKVSCFPVMGVIPVRP